MCPIHIASPIRAREEALEAANLIVPLTAPTVVAVQHDENSGKGSKTVPNVTYNFNGSSYKPR